MTHAAGGLGNRLSPPARGGIPEALLEEAAYEAHRLAALAIEKANSDFAREYAKLPDHVLKRIGEIDRSLRQEIIAGGPERK